MELIETTVEIGKLFKALEIYENIKFCPGEEKILVSDVYIRDEFNQWVEIITGIKKIDCGLKLSFNDGSVLECAENHKIVSNNSVVFAKNMQLNDNLIKSDNTEISLIGKDNTEEEIFYDLEVNSKSHLYQTANGIIHHNTQTAKQLADTLNIPLIKFDMSEYMEKHSVSKLIGSPPGYVGFGDGGAGDGLLVNAIDTNQSCVLLLDEIEKAHEDIFNILLQVMDDAKLTNSQGKTVKFNNVILIMTTNAGVSSTENNSIGFGRQNDVAEIDEKAIKNLFKPEFRNRLDAVITFNRLKPEVMIKIVDKFIKNLSILTGLRGVNIEITKEAREWLAIKGYDKIYGARPLSRVIDQNIKLPLSKEMLFGDLKSGGIAKIDVLNDMIVIGNANS